MVEEPPPRHTRSRYQPPWADELHDFGTRKPEVGKFVYSMTNKERRKRERKLLEWDSTLAQIACWHNQDMLGHSYHGHKDSDDRLPWDRVAREHRRLIGFVGENVWTGGRIDQGASGREKQQWAQAMMRIWMESPGHRANILRSRWTHIGVCVTQDSVEGRATQLFAEVRGYFTKPIPWALTPGDSVSASVRPVKSKNPPARYEFVPSGQPLDQAFSEEESGELFNGKLRIPDSPGTYGLRLMVPTGDGHFNILQGPRVLVKKEGEPAY